MYFIKVEYLCISLATNNQVTLNGYKRKPPGNSVPYSYYVCYKSLNLWSPLIFNYSQSEKSLLRKILNNYLKYLCGVEKLEIIYFTFSELSFILCYYYLPQ